MNESSLVISYNNNTPEAFLKYPEVILKNFSYPTVSHIYILSKRESIITSLTPYSIPTVDADSILN